MHDKLLSFFLTVLFFSSFVQAEQTTPALQAALEVCFPNISEKELLITELKGGLSHTFLYKIEAAGKAYVLRIHQSKELNDQDVLELSILLEAAKQNLSPRVVYVSPDHKAILMEFINSKTLMIEQANEAENVIKLAKTLKKMHQITGDHLMGEGLLSKAKRVHKKVLEDNIGSKKEIEHAYELIGKYSQMLSKYKYPTVRVHGDLNPRNIFLIADKVLFIDWAETTLEDPFYDLSYLSLKLAYNKDNEQLLLTHYLGREPLLIEWDRYTLHKKIHQAFWSLTNLYLSDAMLKKHSEQQIKANNSLEKWDFYQKAFADGLEELSAQYFYDLSRLNYQLAL